MLSHGTDPACFTFHTHWVCRGSNWLHSAIPHNATILHPSLFHIASEIFARTLTLLQRRTSLRPHSRSVDISESPRARRAANKYSPDVIAPSPRRNAGKMKRSQVVESAPGPDAADSPLGSPRRSPRRRFASISSPAAPKHGAGVDGPWPPQETSPKISPSMFFLDSKVLDKPDRGNSDVALGARWNTDVLNSDCVAKTGHRNKNL